MTHILDAKWLRDGRLIYALNTNDTNRFSASIQGGYGEDARTTDEELEQAARVIHAAPKLLGALRFILAFYEPGQTHLDTEAWKSAEASARAAVALAEGKS